MKKPDLKDIRNIKAKEPAIIKEFRDFINRGNVVDMAVGVILGSAFGKIVSALVDSIIMPIISILIGGIDFSHLTITVPSFLGSTTPAVIKYGAFLENVVDFLIVAFVIFIVVKLMNKFQAASKKKAEKEAAEEAAQEDENTQLLREIRDALVKKK